MTLGSLVYCVSRWASCDIFHPFLSLEEQLKLNPFRHDYWRLCQSCLPSFSGFSLPNPKMTHHHGAAPHNTAWIQWRHSSSYCRTQSLTFPCGQMKRITRRMKRQSGAQSVRQKLARVKIPILFSTASTLAISFSFSTGIPHKNPQKNPIKKFDTAISFNSGP